MSQLRAHTIQCPYCCQYIEILIDLSVLDQDYIEDCEICCRPIALQVHADGDDISVAASSENE